MKWRLYFNAHSAFPLLCSLDNGDINSEFAVRKAVIRAGVHCETKTGDGPGQPKFWVEFVAELEMFEGVAFFHPSPIVPRGTVEACS